MTSEIEYQIPKTLNRKIQGFFMPAIGWRLNPVFFLQLRKCATGFEQKAIRAILADPLRKRVIPP